MVPDLLQRAHSLKFLGVLLHLCRDNLYHSETLRTRANVRVVLPSCFVGTVERTCDAVQLLPFTHDVVQSTRVRTSHRVLRGAGSLPHEAGIEDWRSHLPY